MIGSNKDFEGLRTNNKPETYYGLSTDEKPITAVNGSCFIEMDTSTMYFFDEEAKKWVPWSGSGGGGGGGDYQSVVVLDFKNLQLQAGDGGSWSIEIIPHEIPEVEEFDYTHAEISGDVSLDIKSMRTGDYLAFYSDETGLERVDNAAVDYFDGSCLIWIVLRDDPAPESITINLKLSKIIPVE